MTEKRDISRRRALKGIAGTGALAGGIGVGLTGSASAVDTPDQDPTEQIADVSFTGTDGVEIVFETDTLFPVEGIQFRYSNPNRDSVRTMTPTIRYEQTSEAADEYGPHQRRFTFTGGVDAGNDRVLAVSTAEETYENPAPNGRNGPYGGIDLEGVCYKKKKNRAKFRITNETCSKLKLFWKELGGEQSGKVIVPEEGSETIWVAVGRKGKTKVALYRDGEKVAVAKADTDDRCGDH